MNTYIICFREEMRKLSVLFVKNNVLSEAMVVSQTMLTMVVLEC